MEERKSNIEGEIEKGSIGCDYEAYRASKAAAQCVRYRSFRACKRAVDKGVCLSNRAVPGVGGVSGAVRIPGGHGNVKCCFSGGSVPESGVMGPILRMGGSSSD